MNRLDGVPRHWQLEGTRWRPAEQTQTAPRETSSGTQLEDELWQQETERLIWEGQPGRPVALTNWECAALFAETVDNVLAYVGFDKDPETGMQAASLRRK
eukprot:6538695-Lingulodinium_polyedra.AAC.1